MNPEIRKYALSGGSNVEVVKFFEKEKGDNGSEIYFAIVDMAGEYPDVVIGCVGGGSNFAGIAYPFLRENIKNGGRARLVAVEPTAALYPIATVPVAELLTCEANAPMPVL